MSHEDFGCEVPIQRQRLTYLDVAVICATLGAMTGLFLAEVVFR